MRIKRQLAVLSVLGGLACASAAELPGQEHVKSRTVTVCLSYGPKAEIEVALAMTIASKMFAEIGVQLNGGTGQQYCKRTMERTIIINLSTHTPPTRNPGAWAYALPFEGRHIEIFYDRIVRPSPSLTARLLSCVLVHKITHLLQGLDRHSTAGIMKAHWSSEEYLNMPPTSAFTEDDIDLIHRGLDCPR